MDKKKQMHAPVYEALEKLKKRRVVPFDVPGHKRGRGNPELVELLGQSGCEFHETAGQSLPSGIGDQRGRGAGGGSMPCGSCVFHGRRNYLFGTGNGTFLLQGGG